MAASDDVESKTRVWRPARLETTAIIVCGHCEAGSLRFPGVRRTQLHCVYSNNWIFNSILYCVMRRRLLFVLTFVSYCVMTASGQMRSWNRNYNCRGGYEMPQGVGAGVVSGTRAGSDKGHGDSLLAYVHSLFHICSWWWALLKRSRLAQTYFIVLIWWWRVFGKR